MSRLFVAAVAAVSMLGAGAAVAQTPAAPPAPVVTPATPAPPSRHEQLAYQVLTLLYDDAAVTRMMQEMGGEMTRDFGAGFPAEWGPLLLEGFTEEFRADRPKILWTMTGAFAAGFTDEELEAGVQILSTPGGRATFQADALGLPKPRLSREDKRALAAAQRLPGARDFGPKAARLFGDAYDANEPKALREIIPGMFRRWGVKMEAYEAAHPSNLAPLTAHEQLGARFAASMFEAYGDAIIFDYLANSMAESVTRNHLPEEWGPVIAEAVGETFGQRRTVVYEAMGRVMAPKLTDDELLAGTALFTSNVGKRIMRAVIRNEPVPTLSRDEERDLELLLRMRGARTLSQKLDKLDPSQGGQDAVRSFAPAMIRSIGEKLEAYEAAHGQG